MPVSNHLDLIPWRTGHCTRSGVPESRPVCFDTIFVPRGGSVCQLSMSTPHGAKQWDISSLRINLTKSMLKTGTRAMTWRCLCRPVLPPGMKLWANESD